MATGSATAVGWGGGSSPIISYSKLRYKQKKYTLRYKTAIRYTLSYNKLW